MANNIFQEQITPDKPKILQQERIFVYVPKATNTTQGIASFDDTDFRLNNGKVYFKRNDPRVVPSLIKILADPSQGGLEYTDDNIVKVQIKTINGQSLLGTGNIVIDITTPITEHNADPNAHPALRSRISTLETTMPTKQDKLVSGVNIKTLNNESILGSGNITVAVDTSDKVDKHSESSSYEADISNENGSISNKVESKDNRYSRSIDITNGAINITATNKIYGTAQDKTLVQNAPSIISSIVTYNDVNSDGTISDSSYTKITQEADEINIKVSPSVFENEIPAVKIDKNGVKIYKAGELRTVATNSELTSAIDLHNNDTTAHEDIRDDVEDLESSLSSLSDDVSAIQLLIPSQASASNQLADKAFVNSTVQTATANFRGNWMNWASVPINADEYPEDYTGETTPSTNDYMVVEDASGYVDPTKVLSGTWRFKYTGVWSSVGRNGWIPEYKVNDTPFTQRQLAAINSGATEDLIEQITRNEDAISALDGTKADDESVVHLTGNETIAGNKSFTGNIGLSGNLTDGTNSLSVQDIADKSEVSVSSTGTATDEVQYITIDGVEKKLAGGSNVEVDDVTITKNDNDEIQAVALKTEDGAMSANDFIGLLPRSIIIGGDE